MSADTTAPVLVVEGHEGMTRIVRGLLEQIGFADVDAATDGREALSKMKARQYALVISGAAMEPMTGRELLRSVRGDEGLRKTPFLLMTTKATTDETPCIVRPFNARTLQQKIEGLLAA